MSEKKRGLMDILKGVEIQGCCKNHCRDWHESAGGLTASNHAPSCINYKPVKFLKITVKGDKAPWLIDRPENIDEWMDAPEEYDIVEVEMTEDQFSRLPEFEGF